MSVEKTLNGKLLAFLYGNSTAENSASGQVRKKEVTREFKITTFHQANLHVQLI